MKVAQLLSTLQSPQRPPSRPHSSSTPSITGQSQQPLYQNKPPPPVPSGLQQIQPLHVRRHSPNNSSNLSSSYNSNDGVLSPASQNHRYGTPAPRIPGRSPPPSRPATTLPGNTDLALFPLFKVVDKRGTGQLTEEELRAALVNGDFTSFDPHTVKMMIRMFDSNGSGTIGYDEFWYVQSGINNSFFFLHSRSGLWGFLDAWRGLFDRFDEDKSGSISFDEYAKALVAFGYHLSPNFVTMLYRAYDRRGNNQMSFDIFVQSCISLKRMTDVFKKYDTDRDGYITLSFEEFLMGVLQTA